MASREVLYILENANRFGKRHCNQPKFTTALHININKDCTRTQSEQTAPASLHQHIKADNNIVIKIKNGSFEFSKCRCKLCSIDQQKRHGQSKTILYVFSL